MTTRKRLEADERELPLHLKYRPQKLADVMGQDAVIRSIGDLLKARSTPHVYLFTGPAGTGKTTLARIVASAVGVDSTMGITEVDAASNNGVDDMRKITQDLVYQGFGENPGKAIIMNECQRLSPQAWDALLTTTEEPPPHAFFFFTSTHPAKIPNAMMTRAQVFNLKPLRRDDIIDLLEVVCEREGFNTKGKVLDMVADASGGSMRAALTMLANVHAIDDMADVSDLLSQTLEDVEVIDLCRLLVSRKLTWPRLCETLGKMNETVTPETIRIVASIYLSKCAMGAKSDRDAADFLYMMEQFAKPFDTSTKLAPVLMAFGRIMFQ